MFKKFKELEYPVLTQFYFLGIVAAVLVFQFVTVSLTAHSLQLLALWAPETDVRLFAALLGGLTGGLVYLMVTRNTELLKLREAALWESVKEKGNSWYTLVIAFACSIGFFVTGLLKAILDMKEYDHFFARLFSPENTINYIGRLLAAGVFGLLLSIGIIKRLKRLYEKKNDK